MSPRALSPTEAREFVWARTPLGTEIWVEDGLLVTCLFATTAHVWSRPDGFDPRELAALAWRVRQTDSWTSVLNAVLCSAAVISHFVSRGERAHDRTAE
jgi:hypothetical protein